MQNLHVQLRAVLYRDGSDWVAHCLEMDLAGHGETQADALAMLSDAITAQVQASVAVDNPDNLFMQADPKLMRMFFGGRPTAVGEMRIAIGEPVTVDRIETREWDAALGSAA